MNDIRDLTSAICLNLSSDPHLLQGTIRQSIKELCSFSRQVKSLGDYGPMPISKKLFEPVSPGESSPCHSDNCLQDDEEKTRVLEPSLYEVAEIFLDTSAIIEITQSAKSSNWCLWIMICGLSEEKAIKGLLTLIDKHLQNIHYETCKKVVYKGQVSYALHFKEHFTAQKVFTFLSEDFYSKTYIKDRWQVLRFYNRMDDPKYMSQFFGVILENLPLESTSQTIIDLVSMHSSNISLLSVEIPTLIGESLCSFVRTKTLEDAETLALTLNGLITPTGNIRAGLHPNCNFKHQSFEKDPFKEIKLQTSPKKKVESLEEKKNDIKSLLSLFKSELKAPGPKFNEKHLGNVDLVSPEQEVVRNGSQLFDTFSPSNSKIHDNSRSNLPPYGHHPFPQFPPLAFQRPHPGSGIINHNYLGLNTRPYNIPQQAPTYYGPFPQGPHHQQWHLKPDDHNSIPPRFTPFQKFGKKIQKRNLKPTRTNVKKMQPTKAFNKKQQKLERPHDEDHITSPVAARQEKKVEAEKVLNPPTDRSLIENVQSKSKQNLEKIFEKKLADWNIGVYQVKPTHRDTTVGNKTQELPFKDQTPKGFENTDDQLKNNFGEEDNNFMMMKKKKKNPQSQWSIGVKKTLDLENSSEAPKWKITYGTASQEKTVPDKKMRNANLPSYLENVMDQMIAPLKNPKEKIENGESINQKRKFESLYSNLGDTKIQKFKNNIPEFHDGQTNNSQNLNQDFNEEKEFSLVPHKKMHFDVLTKESPSNKLVKSSTFKVAESLGWSIKCQPKNQKKTVELNPKIQNNAQPQVPLTNEKIPPQTEADKKNGLDHKQPAPIAAAGPTNIVFNGPCVHSSNLNYMYLHPIPPNMIYPNLLMNVNHHHPPIQNPFLPFTPQMMVYHNNSILNPLVPPHHQSFWNVPPTTQEKLKNPLKKFNKAKGNEQCPEPQSTPPVLPK